jgi:trehalose 6-phosphate synthase
VEHLRWSSRDLRRLVQRRMNGVRFIVVSNREPYIHNYKEGGIEVLTPASGMATALDPILRTSAGTWIAHGSGSADRAVVDEHNRIGVPPEAPAYNLRRVWLEPELERGYYHGLANGALWPLCHVVFHRPAFRQSDWEAYRRVNEIFADAVIEEAGNEPAVVFIQDYHFGLLPRMLKERNQNLIVSQFWHIPWPNRETFGAFPWREEILDGLLGNDLLGFHLQYHCANFLDTVDRGIECLVDFDEGAIVRGGKRTLIRPFPISIDFEKHTMTAALPDIDEKMRDWRRIVGPNTEFLGIGIDRLDYTKGIPERLEAIDLLLESKPEYRERLRFVQIGVPSRSDISDYAELSAAIQGQVAAINQKWHTTCWEPIVFIREHHAQKEMMALHRLADFCVVSSLHDGMNLVAKEFVASRFDEGGALILSSFTGSSRELSDALIVNPFWINELAQAMDRALTITAEEKRRRMVRLREAIADNNVFSWAGRILSALLQFEMPEPGELETGEEKQLEAMHAAHGVPA